MKKIWRLEGGEIVDPIQHTLEVLNKHNDTKIYIGTDSQNKRYFSNYAIVIAYRYGKRGAHFIYCREKVKRIRDMWTRLWKELEFSLETAKLLEQNSIKVECVELDLNNKKTAGSNIQLAAARGLVLASGFKYNFKTEEYGYDTLIAVKAADHMVKS